MEQREQLSSIRLEESLLNTYWFKGVAKEMNFRLMDGLDRKPEESIEEDEDS